MPDLNTIYERIRRVLYGRPVRRVCKPSKSQRIVQTSISVNERGQQIIKTVQIPPGYKLKELVVIPNTNVSTVTSAYMKTNKHIYGPSGSLVEENMKSKNGVFSIALASQAVIYKRPKRLGIPSFYITSTANGRISGGMSSPTVEASVADSETGYVEDYYVFTSLATYNETITLEVL